MWDTTLGAEHEIPRLTRGCQAQRRQPGSRESNLRPRQAATQATLAARGRQAGKTPITGRYEACQQKAPAEKPRMNEEPTAPRDVRRITQSVLLMVGYKMRGSSQVG